jgi:hypothetical protein
MRPEENGPWRKEARLVWKRELQRMPTARMIAAAEEAIAECAKLAREAGHQLFPTSICSEHTDCGFVGAGFYVPCPNGHPTINGEITADGRSMATARWN